jgi:hypothetical protein
MKTQSISQPNPHFMERMHGLLAVQSVVIILLSINRLSTLTLGYVATNEFLRWVDLNNMLILPLISLVAFYLLKKHLQSNPMAVAPRWNLLLSVVFIIGVYLLGAGYGDHEVTNYLHSRFCLPDDGSDLCRITIFNDDEFSHYVFFLGFILINVSLLLLQIAFPHPAPLSRRDKLILSINSLFIAAGLIANLAFEDIGIDLYVVALLAALSLWWLWRRGAQPMFLYYSVAYTLGFVVTLVIQGAR